MHLSSQSVNRRIFHGFLSGAGLTIISILVAFVKIRLILQFLPKDMAGIWFLFVNFGAYIAFFDLGISPTISREIGFILGKNHSDQNVAYKAMADIIATCIKIFQVLAGTVFAIGLVLGGIFLLKVAPAESYQEIKLAWLIFSVGASLNILGNAGFASLYGMGNVSAERITRSVSQLIGLAIAMSLLMAGFGLVGLSIAWVIEGLAVRLVVWKVLHSLHPEIKAYKGKARMDIVKRIALPSLKYAITGIGAILILQTDNLVIASILGTRAIPAYEAVSKMIFYIHNFAILVVTSSTPFVSRAFAEGSMDEVRRMVLRNVRYAMSISVVLLAFLAVYGKEVVDLWLGAGNFVGYPVLWTFIIMIILETHHVILATATMATGKVVFYWVAILAGALNLILSVWLGQKWGLWGIALGTMIAQLLTNNWYVPYISIQVLGLSFSKYIKRIIIPVTLLAAIAIMINWSLKQVLINFNIYIVIIVGFGVASCLCALVAMYLVLIVEERKYLSDRLRLRLDRQ